MSFLAFGVFILKTIVWTSEYQRKRGRENEHFVHVVHQIGLSPINNLVLPNFLQV